jgi:hypothetical protein
MSRFVRPPPRIDGYHTSIFRSKFSPCLRRAERSGIIRIFEMHHIPAFKHAMAHLALLTRECLRRRTFQAARSRPLRELILCSDDSIVLYCDN